MGEDRGKHMSLQLIPPDINLDFVGKRYFFVAPFTLSRPIPALMK